MSKIGTTSKIDQDVVNMVYWANDVLTEWICSKQMRSKNFEILGYMGETFKENIRREKIQLPSMFYFILYKKSSLKNKTMELLIGAGLAVGWSKAKRTSSCDKPNRDFTDSLTVATNGFDE